MKKKIKKTSKKKVSTKTKIPPKLKLTEWKLTKKNIKSFKDRKITLEILLDHLYWGDLSEFQGCLHTHLMYVNVSQFAKRSGLSRRTLYDLIDVNKKFNPELTTIVAIFNALRTEKPK